MGRLDDKVVLVSGASSGIGQATALYLAHEGAAVAVGDVALDEVHALADRISGEGGQAIASLCDVRSEESVSEFVELTTTMFGGIDCLDHNAAWSHPRLDTDATDIDLGVWDACSRPTPAARSPRPPRHPENGGSRRGLDRQHLLGYEHHW